ncbi:MAG: hypothetical protein WCJ68_06480 [Chitinophagia bacterium]|jgi:hypothetical protein
MISSLRQHFNASFTDKKYQDCLAYISLHFPNALDFKVAETPIFIDEKFTTTLLALGNYVNEQILGATFKDLTEKSLVKQAIAPNEPPNPSCIVMDFAIAKNDKNELVPKLIELQGFPSLFAFELLHEEALKNNYTLPENYSPFLNGYNKEKYLAHLKQIICGNKGEHTVLLELYPDQQKTRIDFYCTKKYLNIPIVCISELEQKGNQLFYTRNGISTKIDRIYNRVIFDELHQQPLAIQEKGKLLLNELEVSWVTHPNHFYRISKYLMPFLNHPLIPKTKFVDQLSAIPSSLEQFILKPLFSFAGQGVIIDIQPTDFEKLKDVENWILQQKVPYAECIETPTGPAKAEIRLFYFWDEPTQQYIATMNLARLSKGKMIGVDYNRDATWVGGTLAYFEQKKH